MALSVGHVLLGTKQYNLVPEKGSCAAGIVTIGLASHWSCVTDLVVYPRTGREMSTLPTPLNGCDMLCDVALLLGLLYG